MTQPRIQTSEYLHLTVTVITGHVCYQQEDRPLGRCNKIIPQTGFLIGKGTLNRLFYNLFVTACLSPELPTPTMFSSFISCNFKHFKVASKRKNFLSIALQRMATKNMLQHAIFWEEHQCPGLAARLPGPLQGKTRTALTCPLLS